MKLLGRLAGGVAHDFNNLLTIMQANTSLLAEDEELPERFHENLGELSDAIAQGTYVAHRLLAFSRHQALEPRVVDVNAIIERFRGLLERCLGPEVDLEIDLAPALSAVEVDPGQVEQAVLNLVMNGRQAMAGEGRLTIATRTANVGDECGDLPVPPKAGPHVLLSVRDTGHGMDEETRARAFEPFFTTRAGKAGTGLGLPSVMGTMSRLGGGLALETAPGKGTTVSLYFPATDRAPEPVERVRSPAPGGGETLLVVEDDPVVLRAVRRMLERSGYRVLTAESGEGALAILRSRHKHIALVLADMVLGDTSGLVLARRIHETYPEVEILLMSGYSGDELPGEMEFPFLAKPFSRDTLNARIRDVLGEDPA